MALQSVASGSQVALLTFWVRFSKCSRLERHGTRRSALEQGGTQKAVIFCSLVVSVRRQTDDESLK
jgi:hypothetical protein